MLKLLSTLLLFLNEITISIFRKNVVPITYNYFTTVFDNKGQFLCKFTPKNIFAE